VKEEIFADDIEACKVEKLLMFADEIEACKVEKLLV
jgi:hypothetical protein